VPVLTAATCDRSDADMRGDWTMIVLRRDGAPPIRFSGRPIVRVSDGAQSVGIWHARTGGFVLSRSTGDGTGEAAGRYATGDETMTALEAYCASLDRPGEMPADRKLAERLDIADLVEELALRSERRRSFRMLAGQALDAFDAWCAAPRTDETGSGR
jgi:hypothetical protein